MGHIKMVVLNTDIRDSAESTELSSLFAVKAEKIIFSCSRYKFKR
jgi:hypothetical protein